MDRIIIKAKPNVRDAIPYQIIKFPDSYILETDSTINLIGNSFIKIRNIYLSSVDVTIFSEGLTYFNPFSSVKNLSAENLGFSGIKITNYTIHNEKHITLNPTISFTNIGFIDVIVENEAGFGILSRDSRVLFLSSYPQAIDIQKPCISGIEIKMQN